MASVPPPNATLWVNEREAKFWLSAANAKAATGIVKQHFGEADQCVTPYIEAGKFETFADNAAPIPGLGSILYGGYTPGHGKANIWWQARTSPFLALAMSAKTARITIGCLSTTFKGLTAGSHPAKQAHPRRGSLQPLLP